MNKEYGWSNLYNSSLNNYKNNNLKIIKILLRILNDHVDKSK